MRQLVIIFEFKPENAYKIASFHDMIRKYGRFAFITSNSCIIWTDATAVSVRDQLSNGIGLGDKLFIADVAAPAAWTNSISKEVSEYIINNLADI
jgi:hypothetical protein